MLDAGCGPGFLLERALTTGIMARGVDVSHVACRLFRERVPEAWKDTAAVGSITEIPFRDKEFDLCVCLDALEHLIVHDVFVAANELCRVSNDRVVCSINLDNPYQFHPTVLSRPTWISIFESSGIVRYDEAETGRLGQAIAAVYPEYEMFVFRR
jgi:2-polyprenyl-3-methyl-5-hydroxy-6-metoxy-1,4-benzoquinol methylase